MSSISSERAVAERLVIDRLGARGDGVAETERGAVYVLYALPGERVVAERDGVRGRLVEIEAPSPERVEAYCPYFGVCGGCAAQHIGRGVYAGWKHGIVASALAQAQIRTALDPLVEGHGAGRRRLTLHARFRDGETHVGYMAARSHDLVDIAQCPIAEPALRTAAPEAARAIARVLASARKPLDIQITATEAGLDVDVRGHGPLQPRERERLTDAAAALDLARLSLHGDTIVERRPPAIGMGRARVVPPPGAFLQATRAGEEALAALVRETCAGARRIADLFAGCGPFSLRLAESAEVHAVETDAGSLAALDRGWRGASGLRRVTTEARDLFRRPLLAPELTRFDAVVIDPPRAGAEAQARQLARSTVPVVASVSCDAGTFARDAAILIQGGYALERVTPVDQFKESPHVEIVGVFRRAPARKPRR
jgi:23S rRNA (uracil1939-C5)-methyltransferase